MDSGKGKVHLVGGDWLREIKKREHAFLTAPCPQVPVVTKEQFDDGRWMEAQGFNHPALILASLPTLQLPSTVPKPYTMDTFANFIGALLARCGPSKQRRSSSKFHPSGSTIFELPLFSSWPLQPRKR